MKRKNSKPEISYDRQSKVLSVELKKSKSIDSDIKGNVVIDYDKRGKIVRVNIYGFSFDDFTENIADFKHSLKSLDIPFVIK